MWARADVRARWRSLVALGVLVGVTLGFASAAVAGARRTETAFARLRERTGAADAIVFPGQVGVFAADWTALTRQPEIAALGRWKLTYGQAAGLPGEAVFFAAADARWLQDVDRPVVVHGRMFDPTNPDEVVVGEAAAKAGLEVGSTVHYRPYAADQDDTSGAPPNGPLIDLHVVGVVRQIDEFLFTPGMIMLSPAFVDRHGAGLLLVENAMVRLSRGAKDVARLQRDVNRLVAPGTPVTDLHVVQRRVDTTIGVERTALLLLAATIAVAGLTLVVQALGRSVSVLDDDVPVLRGIGFDRMSMALGPVLSHLLVAGVSAIVTLTTALLASRWFPIGLAARIDPDRGFHADWLVLGPGVTAAVAVVLGFAGAVGWLLSGPRRPERRERHAGLSAWVRRVAPLAVGLGASMAFKPGSDRSGGPARPALIGAVVGVLGVVGTMTINHGLTDALSHPSRAGVAWDATITPAPEDRTSTGIRKARVDTVARLPDVERASVVSRLVSDVGGVGVPTFSVEPTGGIALVTTLGRAPGNDGEAAIGPQTAHQLHVGMGDTISVGSRHRSVRIVGEALFPSDVHAGFDEGVWLTPKTFGAIEPAKAPGDFSGPERAIAVRFHPGVDTHGAVDRLTKTLGDSVASVAPAEVPPELTNLRNVRKLPELLAAFLALLAVAAVAHVLFTSVRRRRYDFAMLRALGMTRGGSRSIVNFQGTVIAIAGLVIGVPVGVAVGRIGWRLVASRVPLHYVGPVALVALLAVAPVAIALVNLIALWPGRRAARLPPAQLLRTE
jgi:hypothetical protein